MRQCANCSNPENRYKIDTGKDVTIAIAGNPNCGKTTLFNGLTGGNQQVGNWPGVTVEKKEGPFSLEGKKGTIIDLPGIYSLIPDSEDERAARSFLSSEAYDLVVNVLDASNIERNVYLTTQLTEMSVPMVVVINKTDIARKNGLTINIERLSDELGLPVYSISANDPKDIARFKTELQRLISEGVEPAKNIVQYPDSVKTFLETTGLPERVTLGCAQVNGKGVAVSLLERDEIILGLLEKEMPDFFARITDQVHKFRDTLPEDPDIMVAKARYAAIEKITSCITQEKVSGKRHVNPDNIILHKFWGVPIFFGIMLLVFLVTMSLGGAFIDFFDILFGAVFVGGSELLLNWLSAPAWLITFISGGVGGSIQTIATFIPIIFFMFLMLGILEESGYMARAAFVMDKFMRIIGLPGKAFVPLLVGFGCSVPAIMATRTLESRRDRFLTIFMIPFMSCGARLPVYALITAAFFSRFAGITVFSIYMAGIILAVITGLIMKKTMFKGSFSPFIIEIPAYTMPSPKKAMRYASMQLKFFVFRAGKIILFAVVILTLLGSIGVDGSFGNENSEKSVLSAIGKSITPVFTPMGIEKENWPATVGLFTGIFAKEAIIGTLNSLYSSDVEISVNETGAVDESSSFPTLVKEAFHAFVVLGQNLVHLGESIIDPLGFGMVSGDEQEVSEAVEAESETFAGLRRNFSPAAAYAYMLFVLIYFPCVAALGAAFREAGKFYGSLLALYLTVMAWIVSVLFYQIAEGHSPVWIGIAILAFGALFLSLAVLGRRNSDNKIQADAYL